MRKKLYITGTSQPYLTYKRTTYQYRCESLELRYPTQLLPRCDTPVIYIHEIGSESETQYGEKS